MFAFVCLELLTVCWCPLNSSGLKPWEGETSFLESPSQEGYCYWLGLGHSQYSHLGIGCTPHNHIPHCQLFLSVVCACCVACVGICYGVAYCDYVAYCDHVICCNCLCGMTFVLVYAFCLFYLWVLVVLVWWLWEHPLFYPIIGWGLWRFC